MQNFILAVVAALILGGLGGWKANNWKHAADREAEQRGIDKALNVAADKLAKIEVRNVTIRQVLEKEVRTNTVYAECKHTPAGLQQLNKALTEPSNNSELSETGSTR